jgi:hypothetical protein
LGAGIKGVANVANADHDVGFGGAGFNDVAASATDFRLHVLGMCISFHKKQAAQATTAAQVGKF